jgi:two-component system, OmpR family, response regulator
VKAIQAPASAPSELHALVVDDDESIRQLVSDYLGDYDIRVTAVESGRQIEDVFSRDVVDVLILDLKLPGEDGIEIARQLRAKWDLPIIMLTGRRDEADRVMGLESGADDYLTKPFSPRELVARIRALVRRSRSQETVADAISRVRAYRFDGCELNVPLRRLRTARQENLSLPNGEFNLLAAFLAAPRRVLTREQLLDMSRLHNAEVYDRAVDVQLGRLRRRLEAAGAQLPVRTERGVGYIFDAEVEVVR